MRKFRKIKIHSKLPNSWIESFAQKRYFPLSSDSKENNVGIERVLTDRNKLLVRGNNFPLRFAWMRNFKSAK